MKITYIVILLAFISCRDSQENEKTIKIGDTYLHSYQWDVENPFDRLEIDTVEVIDIKGKYVQFKLNSGQVVSRKLCYFKEDIRPFNN